MNKITDKGIGRVADAVAAKHFFCDIETEQDVERVWGLINNTNRISPELVWEPFIETPVDELRDLMRHLRNSVRNEIEKQLL